MSGVTVIFLLPNPRFYYIPVPHPSGEKMSVDGLASSRQALLRKNILVSVWSGP